jgi:phosphoribosylamine--glycine ligase
VAGGDGDRLVELARREGVSLTVVGPEAPLAAGVVDRFRAAGLAIFGPTCAAARIETSKSFAKELMARAGVPTATAERHVEVAAAKRAARTFGAPVVIKATGLAAGKGVVVCQTTAEADEAIDAMLTRGAFGSAGEEILVEEFMAGEELSLFALTDGVTLLPMLPAQDHKRLLEGDRGPNTGGMGAYAPVSLGTPTLIDDAVRGVLQPTIDALRERGQPFTGLLYAGLMLTPSGPKVVEFNCRFGDPETEAILPLLESSLLEPLLAIARGGGLRGASPLAWRSGSAVTTVVAAAGYPESPRTGSRIRLPAPAEGVLVFHAGTARDASGALVTAGGRVLAVTALGRTLAEAQERSRRSAAAVQFEGRQYRGDIGWRELERGAGVT